MNVTKRKGKTCGCGFPVVQRTSWIHENPGRKFLGCKFYDFATGKARCDAFDWVDEEILEWQKDVTNVLIAEKKRLIGEVKTLEARIDCIQRDNNRVHEEHGKMKVKYEKMKKMTEGGVKEGIRNDNLLVMICVCAIVSIIVSAMYVKVVG
ncbi:uncharacterized protein [Spinacia oleracea]|uniref:GRF-type domain-containing protein n=1 Tax=Spinacia oleracea TaxID=3562 RepID=A0A9R0IIU1_SPIOL|nr:uncharacterized protein LOC110789621 [Spinacia oleracea]